MCKHLIIMSIIMMPDGVIVIYNNVVYKNVKLYRWYDFFGGMNRIFSN